MVSRGFLQRGGADTRSKMRPDMMIVTTAEQQHCLRHRLDSVQRSAEVDYVTVISACDCQVRICAPDTMNNLATYSV